MAEIHILTSTQIAQNAPALAIKITDLHYKKSPELEARYGPAGKEKCLQDAQYHLSYLSEAIGAESQLLFSEYCVWAKQLLLARKIPAKDLEINLQCIKNVLQKNLKGEQGKLASNYVETALGFMREMPKETVSFFHNQSGPSGMLAIEYLDLLLKGQRQKASKLIMKSVEKGIGIKDIYENVFEKAQYEIGRLWQINKINVAQEHYCTAATQLIMSQLYGHFEIASPNGKSIVSACVEGDYHEIGLRMVSDYFEMEGWETYHMGANTPTASLINVLEENRPDIVLLSATMTYHIKTLTGVIEKIRANSALDKTKIMVGGYPFKLAPKLWQKVNADGFAASAAEAITTASLLIQQNNSDS